MRVEFQHLDKLVQHPTATLKPPEIRHMARWKSMKIHHLVILFHDFPSYKPLGSSGFLVDFRAMFEHARRHFWGLGWENNWAIRRYSARAPGTGGWLGCGAQELRIWWRCHSSIDTSGRRLHVHPKNGQLKIQCVSMTSSYFEFYFNMYLLAICCASRWPVEISRKSWLSIWFTHDQWWFSNSQDCEIHGNTAILAK